MPVPQTLTRLRSIRKAEEEQCQSNLEAAAAAFKELQRRMAKVQERRSFLRALLASSVCSGAAEDRLAALEESSLFDRISRTLSDKIIEAEKRLQQTRFLFLAKRVERRQVETLLEAARFQADIAQNRRSQWALDEWFRSRFTAKRDRPGHV